MNHNAKYSTKDGREFADDAIKCTGDGSTAPSSPDVEPLLLTEPCESFDGMGLKEDLLRGIYSMGFEEPSMIQQRAIRPLAFLSADLIAQAQSGTGKTATFCIGTLQNVDPSLTACQAIIVSPTRELAKQSASVATALGRQLGVGVLACVGGTSVRENREALRHGHAQLVVGTPGRVLDLLEKRILDPTHVQVLILDEADEMLAAGFKDQIQDVVEGLPPKVKLAMFSATLPPETLELASKWMPDAVRIVVKKEELTLAGIKSFYVYAGDDPERDKLMTLLDLYGQLSITAAVIFVNSRRKADSLSQELIDRDFTVSAIHADLSQEERTEVMNKFRSGAARVLIATDVLARGIDVQQVNLVLNFDLPRDLASYIHRVGRSGRFGRKGAAINFLAGRSDVQVLREIEQYYATEIQELPNDLSVLDQ